MIDEHIERFPRKKSRGISYRETGKGRALLLLHGIGASSASWLYQLESLHGYRLIAWDAPGYGESEFLKTDAPHAADYATALREFVDSLLLKDVVLVASSLGGLMAGAYARLQPERVRAVLMISPAGGRGGDRAFLQERLKQFDQLGPEGLAEQRSPTMLGSKAQPGALELARWSQRRVHARGYRQATHALAYGRLVDDARFFQKPVLVVCGTEDRITPEAGCKAIARAYPAGQYRSLPGLGHVAHLEDPAQLNPLIADFAS